MDSDRHVMITPAFRRSAARLFDPHQFRVVRRRIEDRRLVLRQFEIAGGRPLHNVFDRRGLASGPSVQGLKVPCGIEMHLIEPLHVVRCGDDDRSGKVKGK